MNLLIIVLQIVEIVVCLLLVGVILLQRSKSSGAGVSFGGGAAEAVFGAQMGNVLTKSTVLLAIIFLANTLTLSLLIAHRGGVGAGSIMGDEVPAPVATAPAQPASPAALPETDSSAADATSVLDDLPTETVAETAPAATTTEAAPQTDAPGKSVEAPKAPAVPAAPALPASE